MTWFKRKGGRPVVYFGRHTRLARWIRRSR